jgi:pimeloyl-ACP methyl ester carboxylesterase
MQLEVLSRMPFRSRPTPLLFVHGAWHGAWCWDEYFLPYFASQGYASYALSLRGHGASERPERFWRMRIADYVADLAAMAGQFDQPPVVIGHAMGGLVMQKYLETHSAPAAVLMAPVPVRGALGATLKVARRHPFRVLQANVSRSLYPVVRTPRLARELLLSPDTPDERAKALHARMQDEAYLAYLDMMALDLPRPRRVKTPLLVLGAGRDALFTPREVHATARAYRTEARIIPNMAHDMMLEPGWQDAAYSIMAWLRQQGI